jgi:hypothetical protein
LNSAIEAIYTLSIVDIPNNPNVVIYYDKDEVFKIYGQAAQGEMNWILLEVPELYPGIWLARPSTNYCQAHGRYVYLLGQSTFGDQVSLWIHGFGAESWDKKNYPLIGSENRKELFYTQLGSDSTIEIGKLKLEGLKTVIIRTAKGDLDREPGLHVIQRLMFIPR